VRTAGVRPVGSDPPTGQTSQRHHEARLEELPDGACMLEDGAPWLVLGEELLRWTPAGYAERRPRPTSRQATLITPPSLVSVLRTGWAGVVPLLHPSANRAHAKS
jgi:hypothetical protein